MKIHNNVAVLFCSVLFLISCENKTVAAPPRAAQPQIPVVTKEPDKKLLYVAYRDGIPVHERPSEQSLAVAKLPFDTAVQQLEAQTETVKLHGETGHWIKVQAGEQIGWALDAWLSSSKPYRLFPDPLSPADYFVNSLWIKDNETSSLLLEAQLDEFPGVKYYSFDINAGFKSERIQTNEKESAGFSVLGNEIKIDYDPSSEDPEVPSFKSITIQTVDLLKAHVTIETYDIRGSFTESWIKADNPLAIAAQKGDLDYLKAAMKQGWTVDAKLFNGLTALMYAAYYNQIEVAQYLIDQGASLNDATLNQETPLHFAVASKSREMVSLLLARGAETNTVSSFGHTAEQLAQKRGLTEIQNLFHAD